MQLSLWDFLEKVKSQHGIRAKNSADLGLPNEPSGFGISNFVWVHIMYGILFVNQ
jgi:hypothetical protein